MNNPSGGVKQKF